MEISSDPLQVPSLLDSCFYMSSNTPLVLKSYAVLEDAESPCLSGHPSVECNHHGVGLPMRSYDIRCQTEFDERYTSNTIHIPSPTQRWETLGHGGGGMYPFRPLYLAPGTLPRPRPLLSHTHCLQATLHISPSSCPPSVFLPGLNMSFNSDIVYWLLG